MLMNHMSLSIFLSAILSVDGHLTACISWQFWLEEQWTQCSRIFSPLGIHTRVVQFSLVVLFLCFWEFPVIIRCYSLWTPFREGGGAEFANTQLPSESHKELYIEMSSHSLACFLLVFLNLYYPVYPLASGFFLFSYFFKSFFYSVYCCVDGWLTPDIFLLLRLLRWMPSFSLLRLYVLSACQPSLCHPFYFLTLAIQIFIRTLGVRDRQSITVSQS